MPDPQYPGMLAPGNIDLNKRPVVRNPDGSISTVRSMSFNDGTNEVLVPTVHPNGYIMSDSDAMSHYRATGQHLGKFDTPDNATAYAIQLHNDQAKQYADPIPMPGPPVSALDPNAQAALIANIRSGALPPPQTDVPQGAFGSLAPMTGTR